MEKGKEVQKMQKLLFLITTERNNQLLLYVDEKEKDTAELLIRAVDKETRETQIANAIKARNQGMTINEIARMLDIENAYTAKLKTRNSFNFFKFAKIERL